MAPLAFNIAIQVEPNPIVNASGSGALTMGTVVIRPQVYVQNAFEPYLCQRRAMLQRRLGLPATAAYG
jgi:hypothetical protein